MNQTPDQSKEDAVEASAPGDKKARISKGGCLLRAATILILLGVIAYFVQAWFAPVVDPEITKPVVINNNSGQSSGDSAAANLPEGAITAGVNQQMIDDAEHPFEPLLKIAKQSLEEIDANYRDYTTTLVSKVRADGELQEDKYIFCKIRHASDWSEDEANPPKIPFSVYSKFLAPKAITGQEAIWIKGQNDGKMIAHPNGWKNVVRVYLDPLDPLAMKGNRHPMYEIGFRNLLVKMVEIGAETKKHGETEVAIKRDVEINERLCTTFEVSHPVKRDHFEFHIARIYIDDELNIPIAYEGFSWPEKPGGEPVLLERYIYTDIKLNVGLTDKDFDPGNEEYNYPAEW